MPTRAFGWLKWPRAIGAGLVTCSVMAALSVAAQPAAKAPPVAAARDAGVAIADGGARTAPVAASASVADAGASATTDAATAVPAAPAAVPTFRAHAPPLPPPTPEQAAALEAMRQEAEAYERGARDYKDTITTLVTLHYEQKKKAILGGLDHEISIEKDELKKARENAIKQLEVFVDRYSGPNAQPEATPDAMYRLAALYEERARGDEDPNSDFAVTLRPAVALYKRVIREFPKYNELAGIYYFLGHALNDSRRVDEAQQVWRSLVCHNHYKYPPPPDAKNPDVDTVASNVIQSASALI